MATILATVASARFDIKVLTIIAPALAPMFLAPVLTFGLYIIIALYWKHETLLTAQAFTSVALISLLTNPVVMFIQSLPRVFQCMTSFDRIQEYCAYAEIHGSDDSEEDDVFDPSFSLELLTAKKQSSVSINGASFAWKRDVQPLLQEVNLRLEKGGFVALMGPVGSGKTTLMNGLLGELVSTYADTTNTDTGFQDLPVAYCAQDAWLENASIKRNVIGTSSYDQKWFITVIQSCCLDADIASLPKGYNTMVGSNGVNISGGQKQRIVSIINITDLA